MKDPYQVLGISQGATADEIKKAYRKLVKQYHPDRNPGNQEAEEKFKDVQTAYDALTGKAQPANEYSFPSGFNPFDFFFSTERGKDIRMPEVVNVAIDYDEALLGCEKDVTFRKGVCHKCDGWGGEKIPCRECSGNGFFVKSHGSVIMQISCRSCMGKGSQKGSLCETCSGSGQGEVDTVKIKIPGGVSDGNHVKFRNVIAVISINPHPLFHLVGTQVVMDLPVNPALAVLGGNIDIPSPTGLVTLKVPAGAGHGLVLRLPGVSINAGDFLVRLLVDTDATALNEDHRQALQSLLAAYEATPPSACRAFAQAVSDWQAR